MALKCHTFLLIFFGAIVSFCTGIINSSIDQEGFSSYQLINKCSDALETDTLEIPANWIEASGNSSEEFYNDWIQLSLEEEDPCGEKRRHVFKLSFNENTTSGYFSHNGYFRAGSVYYPPTGYCVFNVSDEILEIQICVPNCHKDLCFPKCCPPGKVLAYDLDNSEFSKHLGQCLTVDEDWSPFLYKMLNNTHGQMKMRINSTSLDLPYYSLWEPPKNCTNVGGSPNFNVPQENYFDILVMDSGHVYMRPKSGGRKGWHASHHGRFCIDGLWDISSSNEYIPDESNQVIWTCQEPKRPPKRINLLLVRVMFGFFCVTAFSFFLAFMSYVLVWDRLNAQGWTIAVFCFTAVFDWGLFGAGLWVVLFHERFVNTFGCKIMGVLWHFFHLATFAWMNALCYDMWNTIRSFTAVSLMSRGKKRFAVYWCYGFGVPIIIVAVSLGIQHHVPETSPSVIRPDYGTSWCGVSAVANFYYTTLAAMAMYLVNTVLAFLAFRYLRQITAGCKRTDNSSTKQKELIGVVFLKLIVLMGMSSTLDFIMYFLRGEIVKWMHIICIFITALRGMAIAWVFLSDRKIRRQLGEKFFIFGGYISEAISPFSIRTRSDTK